MKLAIDSHTAKRKQGFMDGHHDQEVRLCRLERDEQVDTFDRKIDSSPADSSPLNTPIMRTSPSLTPEEHENLVAQQLLQWRRQAQHQDNQAPSSADEDPLAGPHCAEAISRYYASASARNATAINTFFAAATATMITSDVPREQPSSGVLRQLPTGGCWPQRTARRGGSKSPPSQSDVPVKAQRTETLGNLGDRERVGGFGSREVRRATVPVVGTSTRGDPTELRTLPQNNPPRTPAAAPAGANGAHSSVEGARQGGILQKNNRHRGGLGGSHVNNAGATALLTGQAPVQSRHLKKKVRFTCDAETKERRNAPPQRKRQRLISVPVQVIRSQLELHASLQSQVDQLQIEMHGQRLEQQRINAMLMNCIKMLEIQNAELSMKTRG